MLITDSDLMDDIESEREAAVNTGNANVIVNRQYFTLNQIEELKSQEEQSVVCDDGAQWQGSMQQIAGIILESRDDNQRREQPENSGNLQPKFMSHIMNS